MPRRHALIQLGLLTRVPWLAPWPLALPALHATAAMAGTGTPATPPPRLRPDEALAFPRDFGAHPAYRTEWWYLTGTLRPQGAPAQEALCGFQITFFRARVDAAAASRSAFAARQLVFAHAALTDLGAGRQWHDQRIARAGFGLAGAEEGDTHVALRDWTLTRDGPADHGVYRSRVVARDFALDLRVEQTQPVLLQGQAGFSRKGPRPEHATRYYSQPQLRVSGQMRLAALSHAPAHASGRAPQAGQDLAVDGTAWLDHEWGETLLDPRVVGWDWIGMNLDDGRALTAFRLRQADGRSLWAGGSLRAPGQPTRTFGPDDVRLTPLRHWVSPATQARYPVDWAVDLAVDAAGTRWSVHALLDAQELDSRASTGHVYWEGLSELRDAQGRRLGRGYLEMTGYVQPMKL